MFRLKLFGSASIDGPDGPVTGRAVQRRRLALLALLAVARDRGVSRDKLIGLLWPDGDPDRSRHQLSDSVYRVNKEVGGDAIVAAGEELRLNPERLPADAWEFLEAMEAGRWEEAAGLHAGPFMDGFFLSDSRELELWVEAQRERLVRERALALERLAEDAEAADDLPRAVAWWRTLAAQDPLSSRVALRLMQALQRAGDPAAALQHARVHEALLREELEIAPDAEVQAFVRELRAPPAAAAPAAPASTPPPEPRREATGPTAEAASLASVAVPEPRAARPPRRIPSWAVAAAVVLALLASAALLARTGRAPAPDSIAVLPFADLSQGNGYEYFADGITEELIARLGQVEGLRVVGRTSAFAFKGQPVDVREAASRLGVAAVLEGSVRHSGERVRIVAQLSDARNGYQLWSETYDRASADVLALQEEISEAIVRRLGRATPTVAAGQPGPAVGTESEAAFNEYLRGRFEWHRRTAETLRAAVLHFERAVAIDPAFARAYAGMGDAYAVLGFYDYMPPTEAFPAAAAAARRALELQPELAEPHATLAYVALYHDWDWSAAERGFRRAIEIAPGYSVAHQWYANLLNAMGRFPEATAEMTEAMRLDPLSLIANAALCWIHYHAGELERAEEQCTDALALDPEFALAYLWRAWARDDLGRTGEARADYDRVVALTAGSPISVTALARGLAQAGQADSARALLAGLQRDTAYVPPYEVARVYVALGEREAALAALEDAYAQRSHSMAFLAVDPQLAALRGEPRFRELVRRLRLTHVAAR